MQFSQVVNRRQCSKHGNRSFSGPQQDWRRCQFVAVASLVLVFAGGGAQAAEGELTRYEFLEVRLGVPVNIVLYAPSEDLAKTASQAAYARMREIDRIMSDYDPDSELVKLSSQAVVGKPHQISAELFLVLNEARQFSQLSQGGFDVTVGPLIKLWRSARRNKQMPAAEAIKAAQASVGYQHMLLNAERREVTLNRPGMKIDLGAIAKGYAADQALAALREQGIKQALVEAGGDIAIGDPPPGRDHWRIERENVPGEADLPLVLKLANCSVATSGDAYQFVELAGVRYSHIVDPATGLGLTKPGSVTVIAPNCITADALATGVMVRGPEAGLDMIRQTPNTHTWIVMVVNPGQKPPEFQRYHSPDFQKFVAETAGAQTKESVQP